MTPGPANPAGRDETTLTFRAMEVWGLVVLVGTPLVMAGLLWSAEARSPVQLLFPFVPFAVAGWWMARTHARTVQLTTAGTVRVLTLSGRDLEAPREQVRTRWCSVPGAPGVELGLVLEGRTVRIFMHPATHTRALTGALGEPAPR